ncbi:hypothetical protein GQ53DRAFT_759954 [Thozetella sp. PMI_491]|nr:hypothetical protein GQ53DRAFT_759954 [Thozetella sp. PMI_491]
MWHAVLVLTWDIARTKTPLGTIPPPECVINFTSWRPGYEDNGPLVEKRLFPVLYLSEKVPIPTGSEIFTIPEEGEHFDWIPVSNLRVLDLSSPEQENDVGRAEAMALLTFWCPLQRRLATEGSQVTGTDIKGEPGDLKQNAHSTLCKRSRGGTETDDTGVSLSPNKRAKGRESTMTVQYADVYRNGATRHKIYPGPGRPASQDWYIFICRIHLVTFRQKDPIEQMLDHAKQQHGAACWNENESSTQWARCARLFGVSVLGCDNELAERNNAALSLSERSQSLHNRNLVESDMAILKDIQNIPLDSPGGILGVSQNNPIVLE